MVRREEGKCVYVVGRPGYREVYRSVCAGKKELGRPTETVGEQPKKITNVRDGENAEGGGG
jgi:hypothetical protein